MIPIVTIDRLILQLAICGVMYTCNGMNVWYERTESLIRHIISANSQCACGITHWHHLHLHTISGHWRTSIGAIK